ncbi:unnamed protein product [Urochloa decumbens]|uniref:Uncharacterized protein n=1 Tax=Urochloa decumbens TaxID=240449 RepID=A0ABC9D6Z2_9POAL
MKQAAAVLGTTGLNINDRLHIKVAEQLGLFQHKHDTVAAELRYYSYDMEKKDDIVSHREIRELSYSIEPQIIQKLVTKKYLLVVENLDEPINPINLNAFTEGLWLPPPELNDSFWIISTTSQDVYDRSKPAYGCVIESFTGGDILILTLYSLKQAAKYISVAVGHGEEKYWHHVALCCFHYATMLLIPDSSKVDPPESVAQGDVKSSDNLIRQWTAQGILTVTKSVQERMGEETGSYRSKYNDDDDTYRVGNVILEAFQEYSLLHLPLYPATKDDEAIKSAAHFLAYHRLVAEPLTLVELCEGNRSQLEHIQWISCTDDQGFHVSRDWLSDGASGPGTLIIRYSSQQLRLLMNLKSDHFLPKLTCLRVLDLSYTPLESLPPSICCLKKLQLLSLRGCYNLKSPLCFADTEITLRENNINKTLNLLYLDLSYSNISTFQCNFFHNMPILKELLLVKCSNLQELPSSTAVLSSLTKIELIDNKKLLSFTGLTEIVLDGHGTLSSFSLVGTPHIKRVSLHGCKKLESVDIKEADALEDLDLSITAIKELSESIPNLPQLRRLLLMGVPSLKRFPWHKLQRLPSVFYLDHFSERTTDHSNPQVPQVCISDSRLFYSFNSVRGGQILKSFYVRVTSCKATTRKMQDEVDVVRTNKLQEAQTTYADVNRRYLTDGVSMVSMDDVPRIQVTERHVEISAVDRYPDGLKYLLEVTKSISLSDDCHVSYLSDLSDFGELEECMLRRCHQMEQVFNMAAYGVRWTLKNAYVSHLKSLTHFYRPSGSYPLYALKHLVLENCPRLEGVFSRDCGLRSLETLDILFCYNLKAVLYNHGRYSGGYYKLPHLRRIRLQELPLLEHFHVDDPILTAPAWEELHVRGCWSLRRLPRLDKQPAKAVKVSGERAWWSKLRWDDDGSYEPRLPPASASIRKRVVIRTYLR